MAPKHPQTNITIWKLLNKVSENKTKVLKNKNTEKPLKLFIRSNSIWEGLLKWNSNVNKLSAIKNNTNETDT